MDAGTLERLLVAGRSLELEDFGLSSLDVQRLAPLVRDGSVDWRALAAGLSDVDLEVLVRLFTLGEGRFPAWESGARSPVIPLVAEMKARGTYPKTLTAWIKAHTGNRFLPYGSLMDRL